MSNVNNLAAHPSRTAPAPAQRRGGKDAAVGTPAGCRPATDGAARPITARVPVGGPTQGRVVPATNDLVCPDVIEAYADVLAGHLERLSVDVSRREVACDLVSRAGSRLLDLRAAELRKLLAL